MKHSNFLNIMYKLYKKDRNNFLENQIAIDLAVKEYKIYGKLNEKKHFELLRLILYMLHEEELDKDYLEFLKILLFTIFEENAISKIYILEDSDLRNELSQTDRKLVNKLGRPNIFYEKEKGISISNTQTHMFIEELLKLKKNKYSKNKTQNSNRKAGEKEKRKTKRKIKKIKY